MDSGTKLSVKSVTRPDEVVPFTDDKGKIEVMKIGGFTVGRATFEPGWTWEAHEKPVFGTETCELAHLGYCISGRIRVVMNDGTTRDIGPGDFFAIEPGHGGSVLGDEPCVLLDFGGAANWAGREGGEARAA